MTPEKVIIAGHTGLIGKELLKLLQAEGVSSIKLISRRNTEVTGAKEIIVDFDALDDYRKEFDADVAFCCLGTTMKNAGSKEAFYRVDHDYIVSFARNALAAGVKRFFVVSAMGASPTSSIFYNQVKGETERDLAALGFAELQIFRPSLLLGDRDESRIGEAIGQFFMKILGFLLIGPLRKYRGIRASDVALAMVKLSEKPVEGKFVHESDEIQKLAKS